MKNNESSLEIKHRLMEMQKWSLLQKVDHTIGVLDQFISRCGGLDKTYVSFSGGKDSTVLLDIARKVWGSEVKAMFVNTGNEYPDIVKFVRGYSNVDIVRPEMMPKQIIEKYGFPLVSKSVSGIIGKARRNPDGAIMANYVKGRDSKFSIPQCWMYLLTAQYDSDNKCCDMCKKKPAKKYGKETGRLPIVGDMADESMLRAKSYVKRGSCNSFDEGKFMSHPLSIWTEKDIHDYVSNEDITLAKPYYNGLFRTGCAYCAFGAQFKHDDRFQYLYDNYPKWYNIIMNYTNNGVTYREALREMLAVVGKTLPDEKDLTLF